MHRDGRAFCFYAALPVYGILFGGAINRINLYIPNCYDWFIYLCSEHFVLTSV